MEIGMVTLLRVAWIAGTLPILIVSIPWSKTQLVSRIITGLCKILLSLLCSGCHLDNNFTGCNMALCIQHATISL